MAIYKYLDASTGYVTENDMDLLSDKGAGLYCIACYAEGAFAFLPARRDDGSFDDAGWRDAVRGAGYSERFCDLLAYAAANDCNLVRLDADADDSITGLILEDWA